MFYDLNVEYNPALFTTKDGGLPRTLSFLAECEYQSPSVSRSDCSNRSAVGYNVVALNHTMAGKLPADLVRRYLNLLYTPDSR